jgi:hypothetical protein
MSKRCPPGVFCIENYTIFTIFCILIFISGYLFLNKPVGSMVMADYHHSNDSNKKINMDINVVNPTTGGPFIRNNPAISYSDRFGDTYLNPYAPPVNDERYIIPSRDVRSVGSGLNIVPGLGLPVNIRTQGVDAAYRQVGILTSTNGKEQILALMGRPLLSNRDNWQYYTMSERNNIKLPVSVKGKSCMNEYGCDKIYDGDTVYIEGYKDVFRATIYDNDTLRYIPVV